LFFFICKKNKLEIVKNDLEHFHHLDIILANGQSFQSKIVNLLNFEPFGFTHVGIIVKENNELFVLHLTPDGTKENGLRYDKIQDLIDLSNVCNIKVLRFNVTNITILKMSTILSLISKIKKYLSIMTLTIITMIDFIVQN
jgi:hypothetical protein